MIMARLGRESTLLKNGQYIKDLSYMNRDLKDVIYIDFDDEKAQFHKDNVLILPRWEGDSADRELYDIMPFLESKFLNTPTYTLCFDIYMLLMNFAYGYLHFLI